MDTIAVQPATTAIAQEVPADVMMFKASSMAAAQPAVKSETKSDKEAPPTTASLP